MTTLNAMADFNDGKAPYALRTIGEVAAALGIQQHVLRYWEQQFPMLRPLKRSGGRRYYRPEDIALISRIDQLVHREGYTLKGALQAIRSGKQPALTEPDLSADAPVILHLRSIRQNLARALAAA